METPLKTFVERISHTLENVVAPELSSPMVRGQLFAAVELLNQLPGRFEYRHDFLVQDIGAGRQMLATLTEALRGAGLEMPEEISAAAAAAAPDLTGASGEQLWEGRTRLEAAVSAALDLLNAHRAEIADAAAGAERAVLALLQQGALRDLMLFRRQRFDKISQRVQEE
ncbi:MAG: hypothetical protein AB1640_09380 [bacterium]